MDKNSVLLCQVIIVSFLYCSIHKNSIRILVVDFYNCDVMYRWAKKLDCFLRVDNFVTVSDRKACYTSKFCKFCLPNIQMSSGQSLDLTCSSF